MFWKRKRIQPRQQPVCKGQNFPDVFTAIEDEQRTLQLQAEDSVFRSHPIGSTFGFLEIDVRVIGHQESIESSSGRYWYVPGCSAKVFCRYVDRVGKIRRIEFSMHEMQHAIDKPPTDETENQESV